MKPAPYALPEPPWEQVIWLKPGVPSGVSYPVSVEAIFPWNYSESDTMSVYVSPGIPATPSGTFTALQADTLCSFNAITPLYGDVAGGEFLPAGDTVWGRVCILNEGDQRYGLFGKFRPDTALQFAFRTFNACGFSEPQQGLLTLPGPPPGCAWPAGTGDGATNAAETEEACITISPDPVDQILNIRVSAQVNHDKNDLVIRVFDLFGRQVIVTDVKGLQTRVDASGLSAGLHFLRVTSGNHVVGKTTFLKK
jgi:hypothetical protein